ncbi:sulfurtransferase [Wukongibacter baidiensis]|uniref:sulfurtransferase n=1 Tax=Wukongibacter baidiensis TaxID=1723361 RepID=UPI003D7FD565
MMKKSYMLSVVLVILLLVSCAQNYNMENHKAEVEDREELNEVAGFDNKYREYAYPSSIVSIEKLTKYIGRDNIKVVRVVDEEPLNDFIPYSIKMSIADITTTVNGVEGLIGGKKQIEKALSEAGIRNSDTVIIYDNNDELYAARLWWTMKVYGHKDVRLLDGGLKEWKRRGYRTFSLPEKPEKSNYTAKAKNEKLIADLDDIKKSFDDKEYVVLDVRSKQEYKEGHIPDAIWIEWVEALNKDGTFKRAEELRKIYDSKGVTPDKKSIFIQCEKGVRASHTYFVLSQLLGYKNVKVYDGSWLEYSKSGEPIEK